MDDLGIDPGMYLERCLVTCHSIFILFLIGVVTQITLLLKEIYGPEPDILPEVHVKEINVRPMPDFCSQKPSTFYVGLVHP